MASVDQVQDGFPQWEPKLFVHPPAVTDDGIETVTTDEGVRDFILDVFGVELDPWQIRVYQESRAQRAKLSAEVDAALRQAGEQLKAEAAQVRGVRASHVFYDEALASPFVD